MEEKIFMARVAEQAERFDDMVDFLKQVIEGKDKDFTTEERNLLSVGFKNLIGGKRTAIRTISAIEQNPKYKKFEAPLAQYKKKIEGELFDQCLGIVKTVQDKCMKVAQDGESKAFFLKMVGDYYRYVAESADKDRMEEVKNGALDHYNQAMTICEKDLGACNPIRLGLALNFSVFYFEVMNDHKKACELGENALQQALEKIDDCDEETFRDAKSIIELLKENLSLWKEEDEGGNAVEDLKVAATKEAHKGHIPFGLKGTKGKACHLQIYIGQIFADLIESLRGNNPEISPQEALNKMLARFLQNISSWALTTKMFVILHRCLREPQLARVMAQELKQKEHLMHSYQKKASDQTYDAQMYADLSELYANYIKFLVTFKTKSEILNMKMSDVSAKIKSIHTVDLLFNYENFDGLIQQIFGIFEHQNFCKKTRLWSNVVLQLFLDLIQIYKVFYILISEVLERFPELTKDQSQKFLVIYQNFVNFTKILKQKGGQMQSEFGFHLQLPKFYDPDPEMIETLQVCIKEKEQDQKALAKASQNLRNGMNKNQFDTHSTNVNHRDTFFDNPTASNKQQLKDDDSSSGEEFDYDEEDDSDQNKGGNNDLLNYISNMDLPNFKQEQKQETNQQSSNANDFFNFDFPQTSSTQNTQQNQQKPAQQQDIFSLLDTPSQNTQPNIQKSQSANQVPKDPFYFDANKPLIPSNSTSNNPIQESNQFDMFKNLYSNLPQSTIQPVQGQNQFMMGQQQNQPNQFMSQNPGPNAFQSMNQQNAFVSQMPQQQQFNMMGGGFGNQNMMGGNMNNQQNNNMMGNQQFAQGSQQNQFISQQPFMSMQSNFSNMDSQQQQQNPNSKEFTFW